MRAGQKTASSGHFVQRSEAEKSRDELSVFSPRDEVKRLTKREREGARTPPTEVSLAFERKESKSVFSAKCTCCSVSSNSQTRAWPGRTVRKAVQNTIFDFIRDFSGLQKSPSPLLGRDLNRWEKYDFPSETNDAEDILLCLPHKSAEIEIFL